VRPETQSLGQRLLVSRGTEICRTACADDAPAIIALWHECGLTRPWNDPQSDFDRALAGPASAILVIDNDDDTVAGSVMVGDDGHRGWVYYLAVSPGARRGGLGRFLMTSAQNWLSQRDVPKIQLMVRGDNADAVAFYAAIGLERQDVITLGRFLTGN
jgi:ribosomal protein S18 acetylase RimI-like enzyme